jgi:outer membrane lipoprotein-sorting protein
VKIASLLLLLFIAMLPPTLGGCAWVGRTVGKAQAKMERKAETLESEYHQGYKDEKAKEEKTKDEKDENADRQ